jgi:serine/threonine protein kinase/Tfp pilus assembly protein PilF
LSPLQPGSTLSHYRIIQKLGQGGQAETYKAEDLRLHRAVVVKVLRPDLAASSTARQRLEREACLCSALDNPHISAIYDIGEIDGLSFIVMQFVDGPTLKELLSGRPLEPGQALSIAVQVADALAVAHAAGIVHRDIKPSHIIVPPAGQARVLDFGLAKMLAGPERREHTPDDTEAGVPYGSFGYGSPEQATGQPVDHRTDVFSLGAVLYEMSTGRPAFPGKNPLEKLHAVAHDQPLPVAQLNPKAPPELQAILDRALAKKPDDRFQTMAAFRDELMALLRRISQASAHGAAEIDGAQSLTYPARARWLSRHGLDRMLGRLRGAPRPPPEVDRRARPRPSPPSRPSSWGSEGKATIAVLPFRNLSADPALAFYEFALADAIITELGQVRSLVVRPSSYVASYVGQNVDPRQVAEELAVQSVLVGSFLKTSDRLRATAQLLAAGTGEILWSEKMDLPVGDVIALQDAVAARVIAGLKLTLSADEQERIERPPTRSAAAYDFYLRGRDRLFRYVMRTLDLADLEGAISMFNEAVGLDPEFAAAHAGLARCYVYHAQGYGGAEYYHLAERALKRALELDPKQREARLQEVYVNLHHGDRERAEAAVAELSAEAPNDPSVVLVSALLSRLGGLYEEALQQYDRLAEISPADAVLASCNRARVFTHQGHYDRALAELQAARGAEPDHPLLRVFEAIVHFHRGELDQAQSLLEEVLRQNPDFDAARPLLAWCLGARGRGADARALITERVRETARADPDISLWLASFYAREAMADEALEWLQRSVFLGNENYPLLRDSHNLDPIREDPRFQALLADLEARWRRRVVAAAAKGAPA